MMTGPVKRRLATILAFDVVGYSRLMEGDEEGTHRRMKDIVRDVVQPLLAGHDGRLVKNTGDGGIIEFDSIVEGARFALAMQARMALRNADQAPPQRIDFRLGISLGDVIVEPEDIYGEGVNLAARLQTLAEPGGICVTQTVAEHVRGRVDALFVDLGEPRLKNLSRPVRVLRMVGEAPRPLGAVPSIASASLGISGFGGRPAIVVMPLDTFSHVREEEYFADGLTEDITTALANWRSFPVLSRNSAFNYKGRKIEAKAVGQELGARYLVEGSVRRHGSQARITIQLVETEAGHHIFAEHYDREIGDVLGLQEEIANSIVGVLEPELLRVERERSTALPVNFTAYALLQRGLWHHYRRTREDSMTAQDFFLQSIAADPNYAQAVAALSICLSQAVLSGWLDDRQQVIARALELGQRAVFLDARDPLPHFALGTASMHGRRIAIAVREMEEAVRLNPSYAAAHASLSNLNNYMGRPREALEFVTRALRLSPNDPRIFIWIPPLAGAHYLAGDYDKAIEAGRYGLAIKSDYLVCARYVVAALGQLGRLDEAHAMMPLMRTLDGSLDGTASYLADYYVDRTALDHILDGLRRAGFD